MKVDDHSGLCSMHLARLDRHGDVDTVLPSFNQSGPDHPSWRGDDIGYTSAHNRVRAERGRADQHSCTDCGRPAQHWSYDHRDERERHDPHTGLPFSVRVEHYEPRCVSCHKTFDLAG